MTAICPTRNRLKFIPGTIAQFLNQTYQGPLELLFVSDGEEVQYAFERMEEIYGNKTVRLIHLVNEPRLTIGAKRNFACENSRSDLIVHWDDDDEHKPEFVAHMVRHYSMCFEGPGVIGMKGITFRNLATGALFRMRSAHGQVVGTTLCYSRQYWQKNPFLAIDVAEDKAFCARAHAQGRLAPIPLDECCIASIHPGNTSPRNLLEYEAL